MGPIGLASFFFLACAGTVTPPDSTPVYADNATHGIEPIEVEQSSINSPEVKTLKTSEPSSKAEGVPAQTPDAADVNTALPEDPKMVQPSSTPSAVDDKPAPAPEDKVELKAEAQPPAADAKTPVSPKK